MTRKQCKELWSLRFEKLGEIERESLGRYQALMADCARIPKPKEVRSAIRYFLQQITRDERRHVKMAEQLFEILNRQSDE